MLIGIMSDSHDNFGELLNVLDIFKSRGVEMILHAGDLNAPGMAYAFEGNGIETFFVFGNNDGDRIGIKRDLEREGVFVLGDFGEIDVDSRRLALLHGTDEAIVTALGSCGRYDAVVRGHTHKCSIERGQSLVINPGEIWGHFTGRKSAAILDTRSLDVEVIELGAVPSFRDMLLNRQEH
jgi:putative phosphoesterase